MRRKRNPFDEGRIKVEGVLILGTGLPAGDAKRKNNRGCSLFEKLGSIYCLSEPALLSLIMHAGR